MDLFTTQAGYTEVILRWIHIAAGITWIGLLYYFNFVQGPFMNAVEPEVKGVATRLLVPRALAWFRYSALVTFLAGLVIITLYLTDGTTLGGTYGTLILAGMILGTIMFLNVWGVIWPNQKVVIASAEAAATGGKPDPTAADRTRRGFLASRTNVLFSIPMLFFMIAAKHGSTFFGDVEASTRAIFWIAFAVLVVILEGNALAGLTGASKRYLEKPGSVIWSGVILWAILVGVLLAA